MGKDDIAKKNKRDKKKRKEAIREIAPLRYLIVCEGEKTEPKYFKGIKDKVEIKFKEKIDIRKLDLEEFITLDGTGRNTKSLVDYTLKIKNKANIPYGHIWCVFDKDSFPQFNNAIIKAKDNGIKVAWSNESIELWFLLHFEFLNTGIGREDYNKKLDKYFKKYGINGGKYEKNQDDIYKILSKYGDQKMAIKFAKKLLDENKTPTENKPATTVFKLIEELEDYLK